MEFGAGGQGGVEGGEGGFAFGAGQNEARGAHAFMAHADLLLHELDELHELGHGVHAQQGEEPAVEFRRLGRLAAQGGLIQGHGFAGKGVDEAGNPAHGPGAQALDNGVIHADEEGRAVAAQRPHGRHAPHVGARFLDGGQVFVFLREFPDLGGEKIGFIGNGVVIQHAG